MKTSNYLIGFAALASLTLVGCSDNDFLGNDNGTEVAQQGNGEITFVAGNAKTTRAGEFIGATAAEKLGGMFVVEGTKGSEEDDSPSTTVVFDNYLVGYTANTAGKTETNTNNWEYVGLENGIENRLSNTTWGNLHPEGAGKAQSQTVKYWDYSTSQYDFIAWSTGEREAVTDAAVADSKVKVTRINTGSTLATNGFTLTAASAADLMQCYYTDINTVLKANYGHPVTLTFRNMAAKARIALYETVPGYSVQDVEFYQDETTALTADISGNDATLYTPSGEGNGLPQSGTVLVYYPRIGSSNSSAVDYNKASVTVTPGGVESSTQAFGTLSGTIGTTLPTATFAGDAEANYYQAVIPNTNGKPLTLRVNYTLVSTDGSGETIKVYGAKAVVPATYTKWLPNYAYTYVFKISDNSNGWTDTDKTAQGLFPITFDAVVTNFVDANAEQATITTVATPSITTYQQGHTTATNEYSKSQLAGADEDNVKDLYVQVMDNSGATSTLKGDLNEANKSLLFSVATTGAPISEATVMDALQNRTNNYDDDSPAGRNGITLTANNKIANNVTSIINGVDDQPITKIGETNITAGQVAKIDIDQLTAGTYAYVYCTTVPSSDEKIFNVVAATAANCTNYYEIKLSDLSAASGTATDGKVYFVANRDAQNNIDSYTFKQTKVGDDVTNLFVATIPGTKAAAADFSEDNFYFDVYNQNNGAYAVKVIKVVN